MVPVLHYRRGEPLRHCWPVLGSRGARWLVTWSEVRLLERGCRDQFFAGCSTTTVSGAAGGGTRGSQGVTVRSAHPPSTTTCGWAARSGVSCSDENSGLPSDIISPPVTATGSPPARRHARDRRRKRFAPRPPHRSRPRSQTTPLSLYRGPREAICATASLNSAGR
jgi:hypothetical protein